jgi:cardiolipin synthase
LPLHVAELLCAVRQPAYELLTEGDVYYARMLRAIRGARRHVQIMMYIWQNDRIGRLFLNALERKCRQGTQVTIVIDAIGSFDLPRTYFAPLQRLGASVYMHHRWQVLSWQWLRYLIRRNHRKLLIVDDKVAFTGGFNLMREASLRHFGHGRWLDVGFVTRAQQPVLQLRRQFQNACRRASHRRWATRLLLRSQNKVILFSGRRAISFSMSRWLKRRLRKAHKKIVIAVPYFVPYGFYWRILVRKLKRGVAVDIILPARSDVAWVDRLSFFLARRLLRKGANIYLYGSDDARFSHAKFYMIDGYSGTGSANYDYRSLVLNLDTLVFTPQCRGAWQKVHEEMLQNCRRAAVSDLNAGWFARLLLAVRWLA